MDPKILAFAQVMAILVPSVAVLTLVGVAAHWIVERTNRLSQRPHENLPADDARLQRLEHAVEAVAIEVERLGEGQRFVTKLLTEKAGDVRPAELPSQRGRVITPH